MLLNYLKLSLRLLARNPFFTGINVIGLAIGFTSFYALWEYSTMELKADQYHKDADRIARIGINWNWTDDGGENWGHLTFGFATSRMFPAVQEDFPEVEEALRIHYQTNFSPDYVGHGDKVLISVDENRNQRRSFKEEHVVYADSNLFNFFSIPLIHGQSSDVLSEANYVALSQSTAMKYFGEKDPTGELLRLNDSITLKVSGVYEDLPHYTHLKFDLAISNMGYLNQWQNAYWANTTNYVKLNNSNFKEFESRLNQKTPQYFAAVLRNEPNAKMSLFIQPLAEVPFSQNFIDDHFYPKSKPFLYTLAFIALSVLVMAWINYINLSVTRTARRFKEIATRKVSGASASDMIGQFITEALVTYVMALGLSLTLLQIMRKPVSVLFNIQVADFSTLSVSSVIIFVSVIIAGIFLSGLYPAFISMSYQPRALFNMGSSISGKRVMPSVLTIGQLAVAIIFIMLGLTVSLQLNHILNMDTGINSEQAIIIEAPVVKPHNYASLQASLKKEISSYTNVSSVTGSTFLINRIGGGDFRTRRIGSDLFFGMNSNAVDEDFIPFYDLKILAGRNFIRDDRPDAIIISRFAATRLGFGSPEEAIGAKINLSVLNGGWQDAEVIGVIENFRNSSFLNMNQSSTENNTEGRGSVLLNKNQLFNQDYYVQDKISVRISPQNLEESISFIQNKFEGRFSEMIFTWYFLDQKMNEIYGHEKIARNQIILFTILALIIACLGLLGMISNKAIEKTREIGVRKVLGAELHQIALILLNTTIRQTILATVLGVPIAYYLTQLYLEKYSERITLEWWHFTAPVLILVVIMFSTIASVLWKAAKNNPVEALKYE